MMLVGRWLVLTLSLALWACGSGEKNTAPVEAGMDQEAGEGRVLLENRTGFSVETAYLDSLGPEVLQVRRTRVEAGARGDIGGRILPGGAEVEFDLAVEVAAGRARVRRKAQVRVDGEVRLVMVQGDVADPFSLRVDPVDDF
jgi:hypothetical protein